MPGSIYLNLALLRSRCRVVGNISPVAAISRGLPRVSHEISARFPRIARGNATFGALRAKIFSMRAGNEREGVATERGVSRGSRPSAGSVRRSPRQWVSRPRGGYENIGRHHPPFLKWISRELETIDWRSMRPSRDPPAVNPAPRFLLPPPSGYPPMDFCRKYCGFRILHRIRSPSKILVLTNLNQHFILLQVHQDGGVYLEKDAGDKKKQRARYLGAELD